MLLVGDLHRTERPRERLLRLGASALTIPELLAILVGATTDHDAAHGIGCALLASCGGSLRRMASAPPGALTTVPGIGPVRAAQVIALFEVARRWAAESLPQRLVMTDPANIAAVFAPQLRDLAVEEFHVGILDTQLCLEREIRVATGTLNGVMVHPREVFRVVVGTPAESIILVHNHPSGDPTPSPQDRKLTGLFQDAGRMLDIRVDDHVIIGRDCYVSFRKEGWL
ncbi:MAG TPA: DNA repair protein RadC [Gemmatimonadaceae bacterium]|nr:DNA repair protein RadC [Gemmatimonadaceae bacterium]